MLQAIGLGRARELLGVPIGAAHDPEVLLRKPAAVTRPAGQYGARAQQPARLFDGRISAASQTLSTVASSSDERPTFDEATKSPTLRASGFPRRSA
jgi:hypothetical protein